MSQMLASPGCCKDIACIPFTQQNSGLTCQASTVNSNGIGIFATAEFCQCCTLGRGCRLHVHFWQYSLGAGVEGAGVVLLAAGMVLHGYWLFQRAHTVAWSGLQLHMRAALEGDDGALDALQPPFV